MRPHLPELLDDPATTPAQAALNLADLRRYNRWLGGCRVLLGLLARERLDRFSLLDVGAGSGDVPDAVARSYPRARIVLCDLKPHHLPGAGERVAAGAHTLPFAAASFDFVSASLLLHQFRDDDVVAALREFGRVARRAVLVNDLERHWFPLLFVHLSAPIFARSPLSRHDAPASVRQAFQPDELRALARSAGFVNVTVRRHRPWFRLTLVARHG